MGRRSTVARSKKILNVMRLLLLLFFAIAVVCDFAARFAHVCTDSHILWHPRQDDDRSLSTRSGSGDYSLGLVAESIWVRRIGGMDIPH